MNHLTFYRSRPSPRPQPTGAPRRLPLSPSACPLLLKASPPPTRTLARDPPSAATISSLPLERHPSCRRTSVSSSCPATSTIAASVSAARRTDLPNTCFGPGETRRFFWRLLFKCRFFWCLLFECHFPELCPASPRRPCCTYRPPQPCCRSAWPPELRAAPPLAGSRRLPPPRHAPAFFTPGPCYGLLESPLIVQQRRRGALPRRMIRITRQRAKSIVWLLKPSKLPPQRTRLLDIMLAMMLNLTKSTTMLKTTFRTPLR